MNTGGKKVNWEIIVTLKVWCDKSWKGGGSNVNKREDM